MGLIIVLVVLVEFFVIKNLLLGVIWIVFIGSVGLVLELIKECRVWYIVLVLE